MSASSPTSPLSALVASTPPPTLSSRYLPTLNSCHCLNLQLSLAPLSSSPTNAQSTSAASAPSLLHALTNDPTSPFHSHQCLLGHLDSKSVQHDSLTLVRAFSVLDTHWVLFRCLGCRTDCFAVEADGADGRCVMRLDLPYNEEVAELQASPAYSHAFSLVIPSTHSSPLSSPSGSSDSSSSGAAAIGSAADSLRTALDRSVHAEQLVMQMRISQFASEEQARFAAWDKKGRRELAQLLAFLQETNSGSSRRSLGVETPGSPFASRSPVPVSPRPSSPTSSAPATVFQPLHTFLRRPSRQSPRLQRLLMDGLRHSSTMSPSDTSNSPTTSVRTIEASDGEHDSGSTPRLNQPTLSSSLPRTGRMSPRQSISGLAVPQLSGLMRRGSRTEQEVEDEAEESDAHTSMDMIVRWKEEDEERQQDEERQLEQAKQRRGAARRRKAAAKRSAIDDEGEAGEAIFQLDTTSTEDEEAAEAAERDGPDEDEAEDGLEEDAVREEKIDGQSRVVEVLDESSEAEEATDEVHEDGALSDDEAVATTSQADILAIARRSSVPFVPIPSNTASRSSSNHSSSRQLGMVPSSLPIPIPAPLRRLLNKQRQPEPQALSSSLRRQSAAPLLSASSAAQPVFSTSELRPASTMALSSSVVDAPRRASLHSLALERRQLQRSQPITEAVTYSAQRSLSPEPTQPAQPSGGEQPDEAEPFIPPHTLVAEPYFSFSKFRHLADVKAAGSLSNSASGGGGMGGGSMSSSVPSRSMMSSVFFRKDEEAPTRKSVGASGLSAALRKSGGN